MTDTTLGRAIDEVYRVFSALRRPSRIEASPLVDRRVVEGLVFGPLRRIDAEIVASYVLSALTTAGTADDFRWFLPRILELAAMPSTRGSIGPQEIVDRLEQAGWRAWSPEERRVLETVFRAAWNDVLRTSLDLVNAGPWFVALIRLGADPLELLDGWCGAGEPEASEQLAEFLRSIPVDGLPALDAEARGSEALRKALRRRIEDGTIERVLVSGCERVSEERRWRFDFGFDALAAVATHLGDGRAS